MFIRLLLIAIIIPLQSCSNTLIGEKLENSFDITEKPKILGNTNKVNAQNKINEKKENVQGNITKNNSISNKYSFSQKSTKSIKKVIFKPQPYRIILKLSGADPSAPAETVTNALRKAGVQFEVEKIERFDEKSLLNESSLKR
tara:strand:- start:88 stop:516 length:429 start_codon:yes stop_codon:yes gene_type:complete